MKKVNEKTIEFIKNNIKDLESYLPLNENSFFNLFNFIEKKFVISLANALDDNQKVDENLLNQAEDVIDDLNAEDIDFEDFNKRLK